jgi:hypothetical protein
VFKLEIIVGTKTPKYKSEAMILPPDECGKVSSGDLRKLEAHVGMFRAGL